MKKILLSLCAFAFAAAANAQVVTVAGTGIHGNFDGPALSAQFNNPNGMVFDKAGNMYVADWSNNSIRKITPSGMVSTYAGGSFAGYLDGPVASAMFFEPWGLAIDAADNIYVGDAKNNVIRKISATGIVSTLAGSGTEGYADGPGTSAMFKYPTALAIDAAGNIYVGDGSNRRVRKVTPTGIVSTVAGSGYSGAIDGPVATASFTVPNCMAVTPTGDIYLCDVLNCVIRKISGGMVTTFAGSTRGYADGKGTAAQFANPHGILLDADGSLFVADADNNRIRKIAPDGTVTTVTGGAAGFLDGPLNAARLHTPKCLTKDKAGNLYVSDENNHSIRRVTGVTVGIADHTVEAPNLFPNPTANSFRLRCKVADAQTQVRVFNALGQLTMSESFATPNGFLDKQIDLSRFVAGNYTISVTSGTSTSAAQVVKL